MTGKKPSRVQSVTLGVFAALAVAGAELRAQVATPTPANPIKSGRIAKLYADRWDDKVTPVGTITSLLGHAKIVSDGTTTLTTDTATYNQKTGVANAPTRLQIDDPQNTVIGDSGIAYYTKRDAKITGNVRITVRPKPDDKTAPEGSARREFKNPVFIDCDHVDYDWGKRIAVATGNLVMKSDDRTITAEKATYYGRNETVVLTGAVHYSRPNNDFGDTEEAVAVLTEGHEQFYTTKPGQVSITINTDEDDGAVGGAPAIPPPPGVKPAAGSAPKSPPSPTPNTPRAGVAGPPPGSPSPGKS